MIGLSHYFPVLYILGKYLMLHQKQKMAFIITINPHLLPEENVALYSYLMYLSQNKSS